MQPDFGCLAPSFILSVLLVLKGSLESYGRLPRDIQERDKEEAQMIDWACELVKRLSDYQQRLKEKGFTNTPVKLGVQGNGRLFWE